MTRMARLGSGVNGRGIGAAMVIVSLSVLFHDAASERFRTFRPHRDARYNSSLGQCIIEGTTPLAQVKRWIRMGADIEAECVFYLEG